MFLTWAANHVQMLALFEDDETALESTLGFGAPFARSHTAMLTLEGCPTLSALVFSRTFL
jgi:hypothetical protein